MKRRERMPTIGDVADAAGVSISTVSRVVRQHADVKQETREKILGVIETLGYRPSPVARALVAGRSRTVGLLVSDIANPFYPELAKAIEHEARKFGYVLVICNTEDNVREAKRYVQRLLGQGIDGIIHASVGNDEDSVLSLVGSNTPVVFTNRRPRSPSCHFVVADNRAGAIVLTQHLLEHGHRRIGFVGGPAYASNAQDRLDGFKTAMAKRLDAEALIHLGEFSPQTGLEGVRRWIDEGRLPTAIIGVNDSVALGTLEGLLDAGRSVPGDVALAGFDDIEMASSRLVGLTTVAQHIDRMGHRAMHILRRLLESRPPRPIQEIIQPTLVIRRTTGAPISPSEDGDRRKRNYPALAPSGRHD
jgi:LacI family transcriptional regulator